MNQHNQTPGTRAALTRELTFTPINRGQYGRDALLPETFPVTVQTTGNETRLYAWIDAPLEGPADYFTVAQANDYRAILSGVVFEEAPEALAAAATELPSQPSIPVRLVYSVREAGILLGVGKDYLYERINNGEIPIVQLGTDLKSMRRIAATDLQAFIDARREELNK